MKVIIVEEQNHGIICVAANLKSAIDFLIKNLWIDDETMTYDTTHNEWKTINACYGDDWRNLMTNEWNRHRFNEEFDGWLYLYSEEVYNKDEGTV